jgi:predicted RNA-binding Zn-ribbon protein involved in translation (DUF1610 family)
MTTVPSDQEHLTCPECAFAVSLEEARIVPFPCPNCGDPVVTKFRYDNLYRVSSLVGALVIAYFKGGGEVPFSQLDLSPGLWCSCSLRFGTYPEDQPDSRRPTLTCRPSKSDFESVSRERVDDGGPVFADETQRYRTTFPIVPVMPECRSRGYLRKYLRHF